MVETMNQVLKGLIIQVIIMDALIVSTMLFGKYVLLINLPMAWMIWKNR